MAVMKKESNVSIEEVNTSHGLEYDIVFDDGSDSYTVAKCWDYLLAEQIQDTVSEYMEGEYKVVGQEDAKVLKESSMDEPIMPNKAVARKPIAVKMMFKPGSGQLTIHSTGQCADKHEEEVFKKVMTTGKPYEDDTLVAVPVLQRGVQAKYRDLLTKFNH